jgi:hypothetical protein
MHHDVMGDGPLFVQFGTSITNNNQTTPIIGPSIKTGRPEIGSGSRLVTYMMIFRYG